MSNCDGHILRLSANASESVLTTQGSLGTDQLKIRLQSAVVLIPLLRCFASLK